MSRSSNPRCLVPSRLLLWLSKRLKLAEPAPPDARLVPEALRLIKSRFESLEEALEALAADLPPSRTRHMRQEVEALRRALERAKKDAEQT